MRKITFILGLLSLGVQAQTFPSPYCDIADIDDVSVEEISAVNFAGTNIVNTDVVNVLIDKTTSTANVALSNSYNLSVSGNTYGGFDTDIVAFIDWNQNNVLDDAGEVYAIGTLFNTNGSDGVSVALDITVPSTALLGETRVRITKTYTDPDSAAEVDPCAIAFNPFGVGVYPGYGQALDFTVNISPLSVDTFQKDALAVYPVPVQNRLNISYKKPIQQVEIYNMLGQIVLRETPNALQFQLPLSKLVSGSYILKLLSADGQYTTSILKE
ncbi:T9SS type A sorting domain-containing protein [Bizionia sp. KMM 8389]